ncbi:hypothetical protein O9992_04870 [Vibrio lentus]|nr:hypothetical protein [Vibrio lentus]
MLKRAEIELGDSSALSGSGAINGSFSYRLRSSDLLKPGENIGKRVKNQLPNRLRARNQRGCVRKVNDKLQFTWVLLITQKMVTAIFPIRKR